MSTMVDVEMLNSVVERHMSYKWSNDEHGNVSNTINWEHNFLSENIILGSTYLLITSVGMIVGCIGNTLVIGSVCVYKKLHSTGNLFIVNLAMADMLVTSIVNPFTIVGVVLGPAFFRDKIWLCHLIATICTPSCGCSLWTIATIAVNRYMFMVWNSLYHRIFTWRKSCIMCIILWCICISSFDLPTYLGWSAHAFDMKIMACKYDRVSDYSFLLFICAFANTIPTTAVVICYTKLYLHVREIKQRVREFSENDTTDTGKREEIQLAKTLFLIAGIFFVCWTPYSFLVLIDFEDRYPQIVYVYVVAAGHINSSLNCILYATTNQRFRDGYKMFLGRCCFPFTKVYQRFWTSNSEESFNNSRTHITNDQSSRKQ